MYYAILVSYVELRKAKTPEINDASKKINKVEEEKVRTKRDKGTTVT